MRTQRKKFPAGAVRELKQYDVEHDHCYRWDFAWKDPASGWVTQYSTVAYARPGMPDADFDEMVRKPAIACIERTVHNKCGMDYAIANQHPLPLPNTVQGRYV